MPKIVTVDTEAFERFAFMRWHAFVDGREDERGYGPSEQDAITDLINTYVQER